MRHTLGSLDLQGIVEGLARRGILNRDGTELRERPQRIEQRVGGRVAWIRADGSDARNDIGAPNGTADEEIVGRIRIRRQSNCREGLRRYLIEETVRTDGGRRGTARPPYTAVADVGGLNDGIRRNFALESDAPLILPRRPRGAGIEIAEKRRSGASRERCLAGREIRPTRLRHGGRIIDGREGVDPSRSVRQLSRVLQVDIGGESISKAPTAAKYCLGIDLIGDAQPWADAVRIVGDEGAMAGGLEDGGTDA